MPTRHILLLVGLVVAAAGCSVSLESDTTTPPTTAVPVTTLPALEPLVLAADGLGSIRFGTEAESVIADVTSRYGAPDRDTGWVAPEGPYGACPGLLVRVVGFGSFELLFSDAGTARLPEFFAWSYGFDPTTTRAGVDPRGIDLLTAAGIGLGSTWEEVTSAYGAGAVDTSEDSGRGRSFAIDGDRPIGIRGLLDGEGDTGRVTFLESAPGCGGA